MNGYKSANTLLQYSAAQLAALSSGNNNIAATVKISANGSSLSGPNDIEFDSAGNLWVTNSTENSLAGFTSAQVSATSSPVPISTVSGTSTGFSDASELLIQSIP